MKHVYGMIIGLIDILYGWLMNGATCLERKRRIVWKRWAAAAGVEEVGV